MAASDPQPEQRSEPATAEPETLPARPPGTRLVVVGLGASAGGLEALKRFFATIPADSGLSFVVVVHLSAEQESHLADLLQPHSAIPVAQVTRATRLEADQAYVIPPGRYLSAVDSHVRLAATSDQRSARAPVDHFFRTLAETHDGRSVGVVLSGTGADGAQGIRFIREAGGMTIVQDPDEAGFDGMPRSAIATGSVDRVLRIEEMVPQIREFAATRPDLPHVPDVPEPPASTEAAADPLHTVLTLVRLRTGHDFLRYKRSTVARRVARRMQILNLERLEDYLQLLRDEEREAQTLLDDLLINVTSFFRDPEVFRTLEAEVIPALFDGKARSDSVRVWSVGCATGEEAYSLGMLLLEEAARRPQAPQVQVFATDLHERSLQRGREAFFNESIEAEVSPERLERFFRREGTGYRVAKYLRDVVVFATHNLLRDPPFSRLDLIVCRNVMIYLQRDVQEEVVEVFHYALRGGGYLLLGTAETLERSELFRVEKKDAHLYRRRDGQRGFGRLPVPPRPAGLRVNRLAAGDLAPRPHPEQGYGALHQRMVERYAPPSLLLTPDHDIVHTSENAVRYLRFPGGESTRNVFKVMREEFRVELRSALHALRDQRSVWRSRPILTRIDGEMREVRMRVSPADEAELEGFVLVVFDEEEPSAPAAAAEPSAPDDNVHELEAELEVTRSRMQALIEEFETSQEEMRASNEELQSSNEELRSTMEELETSREELQSVNEELQTLNQENRHKVEELSQLSSDLQNLLQATDVATVFLDRNLRILRYTPRASEIFNVRHTDRGRPLADLTHRLGYEHLMDDARRVLQTLVPAETEVAGEDEGTWFVLRVAPYRTMDDRIEGVVITLVDVTKLKRTQDALRESETRLATDLAGMRRLYDLTARLSREQDLAAALDRILEVAIEFMETDRGTVQLVSEDGERLEMVGQRGYAEPSPFVEQMRQAGAQAVADLARRRRRRTVVPDVSAVPELAGTPQGEAALAEEVRAWQSTPMVSRSGELVGVLGTQFRQPHEASEEQYRLVDLLAWMAADFVERHRSDARLREMNETLERRVEERALQVREQEERFRTLVETAALMVWTADAEGRVVEDSPSWRAFTGQSQEAALGEGWIEAVHPDDRQDALGSWRHGIATLTAVNTELRVWHAASQSWRWTNLRAVPLWEGEGRVRGWIGMHIDVAQRRTAEEQRSEALLRLVTAAEEERRRIARELHDSLGQLVTGLLLGLRSLRNQGDAGEDRLEDLERLATRIATEMQNMAIELRPPALDNLGLRSALQELLGEWSARHGIATDLQVTGLGGPRLAPELETTLYRVAQEGLNNVLKHAGASRVGLVLERRKGMVSLILEDDGRGFDVERTLGDAAKAKRLGVRGMRERVGVLGGELRLESEKGRGTTLYVRIPTAGAAAAVERE